MLLHQSIAEYILKRRKVETPNRQAEEIVELVKRFIKHNGLKRFDSGEEQQIIEMLEEDHMP